ncbi:dual specificity protein phosphatase 12-like isoform X2 [Mya arenaria]|nr:dual specificity protein phosphatase 12-like isoform X2 [Mya arenaria]XP_052785498.1 dual specificity protein phosphatase 12-like isoform X2 [Mya arenaria]
MATHENMTLIKDQLFLGNFTAGTDIDSLKEGGITHIITVDMIQHYYPESGEAHIDPHHMYINCMDLPSIDLLSKFQECFDFIDEALTSPENKVLIHCFAGMSRSATIMIAYLMYKDGMGLDEAYATVKQLKPNIKPNPGFIEQLELFENMGCKIDEDNLLYRRYRLQVMSERVQAGDVLADADLGSTDVKINTDSFYKCMKCRQILFKTSSIVQHSKGEGEAAFDWRSKMPANLRPADCVNQSSGSEVCEKSLFIEPVRWMAESIKQMEGKLNCPKCNLKLGSFIWYGEKCPCGTWVAPAFHIQSSKVDLVKPRLLATINQPAMRNQVATNQSESANMILDQSEKNKVQMIETTEGMAT